MNHQLSKSNPDPDETQATMEVLAESAKGPSEAGVMEAPKPHFIVGIGASAGGLEALENLFDHIRADTGLSYVVVQHLSPDFVSMMDELLSRHTKLAIHRVEEGMRVEPDSIYLIPRKKDMIISGGHLFLTDKEPGAGLSLPIDTFFRSLAQDVGNRSIGVVLSGTGSDGSRGIQEISKAGGMVIAQDEASSKFDGMPKAAVETGVVDLVLPTERMGAAMLEFAQSNTIPAAEKLQADEDGLAGIFGLLQRQHGIDFSWYKSSTVRRRVERRLQIVHCLNLDDYVKRLKSDSAELNQLYKDLLIGVTKFFRDPAAFEVIARDILPQLFASVKQDEELRFWVAGCATGEEAYSLAILIDEQRRRIKNPVDVKIFATDVHQASIDYASSGTYELASLEDVSPERIERYFTNVGNGYQVSPDLRKLIVFAPHNIIKDVPFTKISLVSCRNMLIYFQPIAQKKALTMFHFSLKAGGIMFLGPSEGPADLADEFEPLDRHWKIYRKRRDVRLGTDVRLLAPEFSTRRQREGSARSAPQNDFVVRGYETLASDFLPPSFIVDENGRLLYTFPGGANFLNPREGMPSADLLDMVERDLRVALAGAIQRSARELVTVRFSNVSVQDAKEISYVNIVVKPYKVDSTRTLFLISLLPKKTPALPISASDQTAGVVDSINDRMRLLETELQHTKENLQATIEELETSNEELQATNEELVASNEELQSTNEELHSVNEELYTVNAEHQRKISELTVANDDMDNLLHATDIATIFLDPNLAIRRFTPRAAQIFRIMPQDLGRRIDSFSNNLNYPKLFQEIHAIADGEQTSYEHELEDSFGTWYLVRILPYVNRNELGGVVLTLIDITSLKEAQEQLSAAFDSLNSSINGVILADMSWRIQFVNPALLSMFDFDAEQEVVGKRMSDLFVDENIRHLTNVCEQGPVDNINPHEYTIQRRDGTSFNVEVAATIVSSTRDGHTSRMVSFVDITRRKRAEESRESYAAELEIANETLRVTEAEARDAVVKRDQFLAMLSHELRNPLAGLMNGVRVLNHESVDDSQIENAKLVIKRQAEHMSRLMSDLLDVSRVTQGKVQLKTHVFDARDIVSDALDTIQSSVQSKSQELVVDHPDEPVLIHVDRARLLQIIENLLSNASRYTQPGGKIRLQIATTADECEIRVADNGEGMNPELLENMFDMFVQADSSLERTDGGMGVGLTLVKSLTETMGGTVDAHSSGEGKGSSFTVRFPLKSDAELARQRIDRAHPTITRRPEDTRVLIVEDNADARKMLRTLLELDGYQVSVAVDGAEGVDAILNEQPDVALVDIGLPKLDGYSIAQRVCDELGDEREVKLVALTGYGQQEDGQRIVAAGFDEHLVKPVDSDELVNVLQKE